MAWLRVVGFVALGATAFIAAPAAVSRLQPPVTIDFSADPPAQLTAGFYPAEHTLDGVWFAWTHGAFGIALPTLDRTTAWTVTLRISGSRPDGTTPDIVTNVDGAVRDRSTLPAAGFVDKTYTIDPRPAGGRGLAIAWTVSPTFVPGPADPRILGAQVDEIRVAPVGSGPRVVLDRSVLLTVGVIAGAAMGALALPWLAGSGLLVLFALATSFIVTRGLGPFVAFPWSPIGVGTIISTIVTTMTLQARTTSARLVVAITGMTVALQLLLLTHPDMPIGDAIFHTHRFQDVLGGHYLFASLAPGNYQFPYPIGLYLFARPFAALTPTTPDRMMLLRVIVVTVDACASALLYRLVMWWRNDEIAAVGSVVAFHLLPLSFGVIVTANLTNVFGQSIATVTLVASGALVTIWSSGAAANHQRLAGWMGVVLLAALAASAFLSHTSTFAVLGAQLMFAGAALAISSDQARRPAGWLLMISAVAALVLAIGVYYAYFIDVYRTAFARIASETGHATAAAGGRTPLTRLVELPRGLAVTFGVPGMLLAIAGTIAILKHRRPSPIATLLGMWLAACGLFMIAGIITPVDLRHLLAALPVIAILAAMGFASLWRAGVAARVAGLVAAAWMAWGAAVSWTGSLAGH